MKNTVVAIKFSLFGPYEEIEATPENVSTLFLAFKDMGYVPNMVPVIKITQPDGSVTTVNRPQLVNNGNRSTITILPDRIDLETNDIAVEETFGEIIRRLFESMRIPVTRVALNKTNIIDEITEDGYSKIQENILPAALIDDETVVECSARIVARPTMESIHETVNNVSNVQVSSLKVEEGVQSYVVRIDSDINTIAEDVRNRFLVDNCVGFIGEAETLNKKMIDKVEGNCV